MLNFVGVNIDTENKIDWEKSDHAFLLSHKRIMIFQANYLFHILIAISGFKFYLFFIDVNTNTSTEEGNGISLSWY